MQITRLTPSWMEEEWAKHVMVQILQHAKNRHGITSRW
jgi:predicted small metal-binding protein